MRGESELIAEIVSSVWERCLIIQEEDYLAIDSHLCSQQSLSVQRHILRKAIAILRPGLRDINFKAVELALEYLQPGKSYAEVDLIADLRLISEPGRLWISEWNAEIPIIEWPQIVEKRSLLEVGGNLKLNADWQLSAEIIPVDDLVEPYPWESAEADQAWVDQQKIQSPLLVRARRDGDRLQPFGFDGHSLKLSDFMINEKMPKRAREKWPLVCSGDQIVWVPGYRLAHPFRITGTTKVVVRLELHHPDQGI